MSVGTASQRSRRVPPGTVIFRQGDVGHEMFVISAGRVSLRLGPAGQEHEVAALGPGDFFGELALLGSTARTATAVATAETTLLPVGRETFALMMQDDLNVVFRMMDALGQRLRETDRHVQELAGERRRARTVAHALACCLAVAAGGQVALDATGLARGADVPVADAEAVITELAGRGIGRFEGGRWSLEPRAHAPRLAEVLARGR